jgi:hypothetical protein
MHTSSVSIAHYSDPLSKTRPPAAITKFPFLRELVLERLSDKFEMTNKGLQMLPKTLWRLELRYRLAYEDLFIWDGKKGLSKGLVAVSNKMDIRSIFPDLRTFVIEGDTLNARNVNEIVPFLPTTLTRLELRRKAALLRFYESEDIDCPSELPPDLVVLKLAKAGRFSPENDISHLSHLECLRLRSCNDIPIVPKSLTAMTLGSIPLGTELNATTPNLIRLKVFGSFDPPLSTLPSKMVKLSLESYKLGLSEHHCVLPSTLTNLKCGSLELATVPNMPNSTDPTMFRKGILPPALKRLSIKSFTHLPFETLEDAIAAQQFLPSSLEYCLIFIRKIPPNLAHYLPRNLGLLTGLLTAQQDSDIEGLPSITIPGSTSPKALFDMARIFPALTRIEYHASTPATSGLAFSFPKTLTALELSLWGSPSERFTSVNKGRWPPNLLTLNYKDIYFPSDDGIIGLPPSLKFLRLQGNMPWLGYDADNWGQFTEVGLSRLPPNLTKLEIMTSINYIPPVFIGALPQGLLDLELLEYDGITDAEMALLPRTLTKLMMRNSTKLSDAAMSNLPPNIQRIDLRRNRKMTVAMIPLLPQSLVWLDLRKNPNFPKRFKPPQGLNLKTKHVSQGW